MRKNFLGCPVDLLDVDEILRKVAHSLTNGTSLRIEGLNVAKVIQAQTDRLLMAALYEAELVHIDGTGVEWAMRLLGYSVPPKRAGIDLMLDIIDLAEKNKSPVYFLGATEAVVHKVKNIIADRYPDLLIAGTSDGYFDTHDVNKVVATISNSGAKVLFIGISSPKKEIFIMENWSELGVNVALGVGGSFDVISGELKRAPKWVQRCALEWLFRMSQEPRRLFCRYMVSNTKFLYLLLRYVLNKKS